MDPRGRLAHNLTAESEAYGYTLTIWGSGAMLIYKVQTPDLFHILLLAFGAILGFAVLGAFAFQQMVREPEQGDTPLVVTSMVHLVSTLGNLVVAYLLVRFVVSHSTPRWLAFPLVGFQATVLYNVLLLLEDFLSERLVEDTRFGEDVDDVEEVE
ncbi:hypothetical protein M0R89_01255 [Halorussus limi]|uniref:Uncharacterized protein n=1 Tax=Halorussus limi TaxID=2938695 RepID=A0A8U0HVG2_9EURY|nr:hypothetical protein [Halorussus limi]UPV74713.1 hypothetical protein M0R89_01255 [Halorussus limi]